MIEKVYLDNAATTRVDPNVVVVMTDCLRKNYGNPSSIHSFGRKSRSLIESSRRKIAKLINASPSEIYFTSGGTEADNMAIRGAVRDAGVKNIITSKIEHPAVLNTVKNLDTVSIECENTNNEKANIIKAKDIVINEGDISGDNDNISSNESTTSKLRKGYIL